MVKLRIIHTHNGCNLLGLYLRNALLQYDKFGLVSLEIPIFRIIETKTCDLTSNTHFPKGQIGILLIKCSDHSLNQTP